MLMNDFTIFFFIMISSFLSIIGIVIENKKIIIGGIILIAFDIILFSYIFNTWPEDKVKEYYVKITPNNTPYIEHNNEIYNVGNLSNRNLTEKDIVKVSISQPYFIFVKSFNDTTLEIK